MENNPSKYTPKVADAFGDAEQRFVWNPYIPVGDYTVLMADGGTGKTILCCGIAADLSQGRRLPGEIEDREPQKVLIISAEDSGELLKKRLAASDADLNNVLNKGERRRKGIKMDIVQDVYNSLEASTKEVQKIVAEQNDLEEKVKNGRYSTETVQNEIKPRIDDLKRKTNALSEQAVADAKALVSKYRAEIEERNNLDPAELNDDIKLLQAGIPLSARDVEVILKRNENNRTMTTLALRYAEQHDLKLDHRPYTFELEMKSARETADALDQVLIYYPNWIATDHAFTMLDKFFALN